MKGCVLLHALHLFPDNCFCTITQTRPPEWIMIKLKKSIARQLVGLLLQLHLYSIIIAARYCCWMASFLPNFFYVFKVFLRMLFHNKNTNEGNEGTREEMNKCVPYLVNKGEKVYPASQGVAGDQLSVECCGIKLFIASG